MLPLFIIHRNIDTKALFTCKTNIRHEGLAKTQTSLLQLASLHLYVKGWRDSDVMVWLQTFVS